MIFRRVNEHDDTTSTSGHFSNSADMPRPITPERIGEVLKENDYRFSKDDDGDLTGVWDDNQFWFILGGAAKEVLQIRGRWQKAIPPEQRTSALLAVNDWNRDHLWPKAYFRDEGELALYAEVSVDLECGVTTGQLHDILACGLITAVQFFSEIGDSLLEDDLPSLD
jgi:hypothetical protein